MPAGMPPSTPICVEESESKYSMRSFTSAMAPARDLLFVTTSSENWNAAAMPKKTTSMSAVPTTVSRSVAPFSPLRGIGIGSNILRQLIYRRDHRDREKADCASDEDHEERLDDGRKVFCFPVDFILVKNSEALQHFRDLPRFLTDGHHFPDERRIEVFTTNERSRERLSLRNSLPRLGKNFPEVRVLHDLAYDLERCEHVNSR